jgi:CheY-like chemotaxis protein
VGNGSSRAVTIECKLRETLLRDGLSLFSKERSFQEMANLTQAEVSSVLVVEDNRGDVFLVERAVEFHKLPVKLTVVDDGEQALKFLEAVDADENQPCPSLVLLDLNLPKRPGNEVLRRMRSSGRCREVPVIVLTSSDSAGDRKMATELGATRYFRKPTSYDEFLKIGEVMKEVLRDGK